MNTLESPPITNLDELTEAVRQIAELELALIKARTACEAAVEQLKALHATETAAHAEKRRALEALAIDYVQRNRALLMPKNKAFKVLGHEFKVTPTSAVSVPDEAAVVGVVMAEAEHGADEGTRNAAEACLRRKLPTLDKEYVHKHWTTHEAWFRSLGLAIVEGEKWALKLKFQPAELA